MGTIKRALLLEHVFMYISLFGMYSGNVIDLITYPI